jgi:hypothetical protein
MRNPYRIADRLRLDVACQVVHLERGESASIVDLVTLAPAAIGHRPVPAGSPLAIRFAARDASAACADALQEWERDGVVVELSVRRARRGIRCTLALGPHRMTLRTSDATPLAAATRLGR